MAEETHGTSPLLRFALLADYPEHMDRVGPLHEAEWGRFAHVFGRKTPEDRVKEWIRNAEEFKAGKRKLDVIFAALDGCGSYPPFLGPPQSSFASFVPHIILL